MSDSFPLDAVTDASRKPAVKNNEILVPLKFDDAGDVLTEETFDVRKHLKRLTRNDLVFLQEWRKNAWDTGKTLLVLGLNEDKAKRLVAKLSVFRSEDARVQMLSQIPTTSWIQAKHMENIYDGGALLDSQRDSLKELAKINGAYKTQAVVSNTINVFQMPKLTAEAAAKLKEFADLQADVVETDVV